MSPLAPPRPRTATQVARWRALGTYVDLRVDDPRQHDRAVELARDVLTAFDQACSRFRVDSDLSRANAAAGQWVAVGPLLVAAVEVAINAAHDTDGLVDPTMGQVIAALGYDRPFDELSANRAVRPRRAGGHASPTELPRTGSERQLWRDIEFTQEAIRVPRGCALDLGGTGKAVAADLVAAAIGETLQVGLIVSVGGDVRAYAPEQAEQAEQAASMPSCAARPSGPLLSEPWLARPASAWPVAVAATIAELPPSGLGPTEFIARSRGRQLDPSGAGGAIGPATSEVIGLTHGGLATSSVAARRWVTAGRRHHHILDPRTGTSASTCWRYASVQAEACSVANAASLAALVLSDEAPTWLAHRGLSARLVDHAGRVVRLGAWPTTQAGAA